MSTVGATGSASSKLTFEQKIEAEEKKFKRDMCLIISTMAIAILSGLFACTWLVTASYLPISPSIKLTVLALSTAGFFCFFFIGVCLMQKKEREDDAEYEKLRTSIYSPSSSNKPTYVTKQPPATNWRERIPKLPSKEETVKEFNALTFAEFLKKPYRHEAFEKGHLSYKDAETRDKLLAWLSTASLTDAVYAYNKVMDEVFSETALSCFLLLQQKYIELRDEHDKKYTTLYEQELETSNQLNAQHRLKEGTLRKKAADFEGEIIRVKRSFISDPSFVIRLESEQKEVIAEIIEAKKALDAEKEKLSEATKEEEEVLKAEFERMIEPLEERWAALRQTLMPAEE